MWTGPLELGDEVDTLLRVGEGVRGVLEPVAEIADID
jgi:hypothetical protein